MKKFATFFNIYKKISKEKIKIFFQRKSQETIVKMIHKKKELFRALTFGEKSPEQRSKPFARVDRGLRERARQFSTRYAM